MLRLEDLDEMESRVCRLLDKTPSGERQSLTSVANDLFRLSREMQALLKKTTRSGETFVLGDFSGRGGDMHVAKIRWLEERLAKLASSEGAAVESEIQANARRLSAEQELETAKKKRRCRINFDASGAWQCISAGCGSSGTIDAQDVLHDDREKTISLRRYDDTAQGGSMCLFDGNVRTSLETRASSPSPKPQAPSPSTSTVLDACKHLNDAELTIVLRIAARLEAGRKCYGSADPSRDTRDFVEEAINEAADLFVYLEFERQKREANRDS